MEFPESTPSLTGFSTVREYETYVYVGSSTNDTQCSKDCCKIGASGYIMKSTFDPFLDTTGDVVAQSHRLNFFVRGYL